MTTLATAMIQKDRVETHREVDRHHRQYKTAPPKLIARLDDGDGDAGDDGAKRKPGHTRERDGRSDTLSHPSRSSKAKSGFRKPGNSQTKNDYLGKAGACVRPRSRRRVPFLTTQYRFDVRD